VAYKIPKNLTKYSELFLWGLSFKQFGYAALTISISLLIIIRLEYFSLPIRISLTIPVILLGAALMFLKIDERIMTKSNLSSSLRKTGYYDKKIDSFISIKEINDNIVFLKSGKILGVMEVKPIDFEILSDDQQDYVMNTYRNWLRNLSFEVQITSKSVDLDMTQWIDNLSKKKHTKTDKKRFNSFKNWMTKKISKEKVRNRVFYLVTPLKVSLKTKDSKLKNIMYKLLGVTPSSTIDKTDQSYKNAVRELHERLTTTKEILEMCNLKLKRLNTEELLSLYSSYFTNNPGRGKSYLTPITWLKK